MNIKTRLATLLFAITAFVFFNSSSAGRENISTNGCQTCHNGGGGGGGNISLIPSSNCVLPGSTTAMTVCISDPNAVVGGFTMNSSAGNFVSGAGSRLGSDNTWLSQNASLPFAGGSACWTFDYVAPMVNGIVNFDLYGNAANGNFNNGSGDDPYIGAGSIEVKTALPISMSSFELTNNQDKTVALNWATDSETNNEYFTVERSLDGRNFEGLIDVEGQGNSTSKHAYTFVDENPVHNQTMYYRIQQIDFDGRAAFSEVKSIKLSLLDIQIEKLYPVPVALGQPLNLAFTMPYESNVEIDVLTSDGKLVDKIQIDAQSGLNEINIPLNKLQNIGLYYLVVGNELTKIEARPFVVR